MILVREKAAHATCPPCTLLKRPVSLSDVSITAVGAGGGDGSLTPGLL